MSKELAVVGMVIDAHFLVVGEKAFMQHNCCHDTLYLGIICAAETLNKTKDSNHILILANAGKKLSGLEIIFEVRGALMIHNNISFGYIFVILLLAFTRLCVCLLPKVRVNFGDGDEFSRLSGVGLGLGNIWENNVGWCHVAKGLGNVVAMVEL